MAYSIVSVRKNQLSASIPRGTTKRGVAECDEPTEAPGLFSGLLAEKHLAVNSFRLAQDSVGTTETLAFLHSSNGFSPYS